MLLKCFINVVSNISKKPIQDAYADNSDPTGADMLPFQMRCVNRQGNAFCIGQAGLNIQQNTKYKIQSNPIQAVVLNGFLRG